MPLQPYIPPQGFIPGGDVTPPEAAAPVYEFDAAPVESSNKAVRSGGLFTVLATKEPTIVAPTENAANVVWTGEKNWRNLLDWVADIIAEYGPSVTWDDIDGKPDGLITEEADPTVPAWVKAITENQKAALEWFNAKFPRTELTPGNLIIVAQNGDSITQMPLSDMLADLLPGLTGYMSGLVSPPSSLSVAQVSTDIAITWTDIQRRAGYYQVQVKWRLNNGDWTEYVLINQVEFSELSHIWDTQNIPPHVTHVGARVRYIRGDNTASAWIEAQTTYNAGAPVVVVTTYEIVAGSGRWWSDQGEVLQTQYEIIPGSGRWWSDTVVTPPTTTPNAPNPITVTRFNANTIDVVVPDNNTGVDNYEYNYREANTTTWYILKADGSLSTNATGPLLLTFADNISTRLLSLTNAFFASKIIEARARTWVGGVASAWSNVVREATGGGGGGGIVSQVARTAKINIVKASGMYSDTEADTDGIYVAYYYLNARPYKDGSGNRKKFENEAFVPGLLMQVAKIFADPAHFTSWAVLEETMYIADMVGGTPSWIQSYAQQDIITT